MAPVLPLLLCIISSCFGSPLYSVVALGKLKQLDWHLKYPEPLHKHEIFFPVVLTNAFFVTIMCPALKAISSRSLKNDLRCSQPPLWMCFSAMGHSSFFISVLQPLLPLFLPSPALRSPMSVPPGSYPAHFGVVSHAGLNGELASPGGFGGALTLSPQISAAASAYSRSPMVSTSQTILLCQRLIYDLTLWMP